MGPERTEELLRSANEMVTAAQQSGNLEILHEAHDWGLPLYLELGEIAGAEAEIEGMAQIDTRIRQRTYSIQALGSHIMLALMRGEFTDA